MCSTALAWEAAVTGVNVGITYTEPTTNMNGTPLLDLYCTKPFYDMGQGWVGAGEIPASNPMGGQEVTSIIAIPVVGEVEVDVRIKLNSQDDAGNLSDDSEIKIINIDKERPGRIK